MSVEYFLFPHGALHRGFLIFLGHLVINNASSVCVLSILDLCSRLVLLSPICLMLQLGHMTESRKAQSA